MDSIKSDTPISLRAQKYQPILEELMSLKEKDKDTYIGDELYSEPVSQHRIILSWTIQGISKAVNESKFHTFVIIVLLFLFTIIVTFQMTTDEETHQDYFIAFRYIESFLIAVFWFNLTLRFVKNPSHTFRRPWVYLDILVTTLISFPSSSIPFIASILDVDYNLLKGKTKFTFVFQNLAILKMCFCLKPIQKVFKKTVMQPIAKLYIACLILVIISVYTIFGIYFFKSYIESEDPNLEYQSRFRSFSTAWTTMFQIMTFDDWYKLFNDITKVESTTKTYFFFLSWIWIGGFILAHLFVGLFVDNFLNLKGKRKQRKKRTEKKMQAFRQLMQEKMELHHKLNEKRMVTVYPDVRNIGLKLKSQSLKLKQLIKEFDTTQVILKKDTVKKLDIALSLFGTRDNDMWQLSKEDFTEYISTLYTIVQNLTEGNQLNDLYAGVVHQITNSGH